MSDVFRSKLIILSHIILSYLVQVFDMCLKNVGPIDCIPLAAYNTYILC